MSLETANNTVRTHFRPKTFPKRALYIQPEDVAGEADVLGLGLGDVETLGEDNAERLRGRLEAVSGLTFAE